MNTIATEDAPLQVTADTKIGEVLRRYGDIADVMESFGVKRVGKYNFRRLVGKVITVRRAAKVHDLPLEVMIEKLQGAIDLVHAEKTTSAS